MRFVNFLALAALLAVGVSNPAAALPANIVADINAAAASTNAITAQEQAVGSYIGDKSLQWLQARRAKASGDLALSVAVATAIAQYPHLTGEIVATAVAAAPASRVAIAQYAARNYPLFSDLIYQATGVSAPPRSSAMASALPIVPPEQSNAGWPGTPSTAAYRSTRAPYNPSYRRALNQAALNLPIDQPAYPTPQMPTPLLSPVARPQFAVVPAAAPKDTGENDGDSQADHIDDPIEGFNRAVFAVNDVFDTMIFRPLAALYGYLTPDPAKIAARRFFKNLTAPVLMVNDLVQLDGTDAAVTAGRFVVNSTIGVLGLFDVATSFGLEEHHADFGQSLHSYGVGSGPYIVLPVLGPSTLRDGFGQGVDYFIDPLNYVLASDWKTRRTVGSALVQREDLVFPLDELRSSSVDYYSALRAAYYQKRRIQLRKGRGSSKATQKATDDLFDNAE